MPHHDHPQALAPGQEGQQQLFGQGGFNSAPSSSFGGPAVSAMVSEKQEFSDVQSAVSPSRDNDPPTRDTSFARASRHFITILAGD